MRHRKLLPTGVETPRDAPGGDASHIVFVLRSLDAGGAQVLAEILGRGLRAHGQRVTYLVFYSGGVTEDEVRAAGLPVISIHKRGRWDLLVIARLALTLRRLRPDVVYGWLPMSNLFCVLVKPFLRPAEVVASVHMARRDLTILTWPERVSHWLNIRAVRLADRVIVNSSAGLDELLVVGRVPHRKLHLVSNGVDTDRFHPDADVRAALRDEWGLGPTEVLFGLVATRFERFKGYDVFLRAAALAAAELPEATFVCLGAGPPDRTAALRDLAEDLGIGSKVRWAGVRADVQAVYNALDVLVCSSYSEGGPNVVIEAMACGTPCAVTDVGSAREMVGDTGVCVPVGDHHQLAGAMLRLVEPITREPDRVADECRRRAVEEFGLEAYVTRTLSALGKRPAAARV